MKKANISTLKSRLSDYVAYVRKGGVVRVYDRDVPVAEIIPFGAREETKGEAIEQIIARKVRDGGIRPARARIVLPKKLIRTRASVVDALLQDRREGR